MSLTCSILQKQFEDISPLALKVYQGKRVLFIVPQNGLQDDKGCPFSYLDFAANDIPLFMLPECRLSLTIQQQREFVSKEILTNPASRIVVVTGSPVILSDAFDCQVYCLENETLKPVSFSTFGAEPSRIALHIMNLKETIGELADKTLSEFLAQEDWSKPELEEVCRQIGGGRPRAKLRETLKSILKEIIASRAMTENEFAILCGQYLIDPALALEDEQILAALKAKDRAKVEQLLRENF